MFSGGEPHVMSVAQARQVGDKIRERYAEEGSVSLEFLRELLPDDDSAFIGWFMADINVDSPFEFRNSGIIDDREYSVADRSSEGRYRLLLDDLRQRSPLLQRVRLLAERAQCEETEECRDGQDVAIGEIVDIGLAAAKAFPNLGEAKTFLDLAAPFFDNKSLCKFVASFTEKDGDIMKALKSYFMERVVPGLSCKVFATIDLRGLVGWLNFRPPPTEPESGILRQLEEGGLQLSGYRVIRANGEYEHHADISASEDCGRRVSVVIGKDGKNYKIEVGSFGEDGGLMALSYKTCDICTWREAMKTFLDAAREEGSVLSY